MFFSSCHSSILRQQCKKRAAEERYHRKGGCAEAGGSIRKSETFQNVMADGNDVKLADKKDIIALMDEFSTEYQVEKEKESGKIWRLRRQEETGT